MKRTLLSRIRLPIGVRFRSGLILQKFRTLQSYLEYTRGKHLSTISPHFVGTLYELTTLQFLEKFLGVKRLIHSGGASDNGVDLRGTWKLSRFHPVIIKDYGLLRVNTTGNRLKPIVSKKEDKVQVLVQCKLYQSKIGSAKIRELSGSFKFNVRLGEKNKTILLIVTPATLTTKLLLQLDSSDFAVILINLTLLRLISKKLNAYEIENYKGGELRGFYMNPYCQVLLKDLTLENELKKLMSKDQ